MAVVAQNGCPSTSDAIRLSQEAEKSGVTAFLVASPFGERIRWRERLAFYTQLHKAVSLPILIYNPPPARLLSFDQIKQLAELPNVNGIKDSSGARAVVFGAASFIPELIIVMIATLHKNGSAPACLELWSRLRPFPRFIDRTFNSVAMCKVGCKMHGIDVGEVGCALQDARRALDRRRKPGLREERNATGIGGSTRVASRKPPAAITLCSRGGRPNH